MASAVANVLLFVGALYFYGESSYLAAGLCALALVYRILQARIGYIVSFLSNLDPNEQRANTMLECHIHVENVLSHPCIPELYGKLRQAEKIDAPDCRQWVQTLLDNYKQKYKRDDLAEVVKFNVKSSLLFKNGTVEFGDVIYHDIRIPYVYPENEESGRRSLALWSIEHELEIRVLLVNGILKLQIGDFNKDFSPEILKDGFMGVYQRWATVTSFPLLYFGHRHALPVRYLNLSSHATESYAAHKSNGHKQEKPAFWKRKRGMFDDWQRLHQELAMYRTLCDIDSTGGYSKWEKMSKAFEAKRDKLLEAERFKTSRTRDDDDSWRYPDTGEVYRNSYLHVAFQNFNLNREWGAEHWFTDYYEEEP